MSEHVQRRSLLQPYKGSILDWHTGTPDWDGLMKYTSEKDSREWRMVETTINKAKEFPRLGTYVFNVLSLGLEVLFSLHPLPSWPLLLVLLISPARFCLLGCRVPPILPLVMLLPSGVRDIISHLHLSLPASIRRPRILHTCRLPKRIY